MKEISKFLIIPSFCLVLGAVITPVHATTVEQYIEQAKQYQQKGEYRSAIIQLKDALQKDINQPQAHILLAENYLKIGAGASAEKELKRAQGLGGADEQILPLLGQAYIQQGKFKAVLDEINPSQVTSPRVQASLLALLGEANLGLRKNSEAQRNFEDALKLDADSEEAWLGKTRLALLNKNYGVATKLLDTMVDKFPQSAEVWILKGELHRQRSEFSAGAAAFEKAVSLEPENINAHLGAAMMLIAENKYKKGQSHIDAVTKLVPHHPMANYLTGLSAYRQGKFDAAVDALNQMVSVSPNFPPAYLLLGASQYNTGALEQAAKSLERYLKDVPGNLSARKLYAATQLKLKDPARAIETLDVALKQHGDDPQLLSLMGSAYMQKGDAAKGVEYLEKAVAKEPNAPDAAKTRTALALGYFAAGESDRAVSQLESAVDLGQGSSQANILLILAHLQRHEFDKALEASRKLQNRKPNDPVAANLMGGAYLGKKDVAAARKEFEKALKIDPSFTPAHANLAKMDEAGGNIAGAKQHFQAILDKDDKNIEALTGMARLADRAGDQKEVLHWLQLARTKVPDAVEPGVLLARYYLAHGDALKALSVSQDLTDRNPDNVLALETAGQVQLANNQPSNAIVSFRHITELDPKSAQAYYLLSAAQVKAKDLDGALDSVNKALKLQPDFPAALISLSSIHFQQGHKQDAMADVKRLQKLQPDLAAGYEMEGNIYLQDRRFDRAEKAYEKAYAKGASAGVAIKLYEVRRLAGKDDDVDALQDWVKAHPDDMKVAMMLASAYQSEKRDREAITQYEKILRKEPNNPVVLNNLAWLYEGIGDKRSIDYAERAYKLKPDAPAIMDTLGWLSLLHGKGEQAVKLLQDASMRAPHLPEIRYHMAVALEKTGHKDEARKELERLLNEKQDFPEIESAKALLKKIESK